MPRLRGTCRHRARRKRPFPAARPVSLFPLCRDRSDAEDDIRKTSSSPIPILPPCSAGRQPMMPWKSPTARKVRKRHLPHPPKEAYTAGTQYKAALTGGEDVQESSFAGKPPAFSFRAARRVFFSPPLPPGISLLFSQKKTNCEKCVIFPLPRLTLQDAHATIRR